MSANAVLITGGNGLIGSPVIQTLGAILSGSRLIAAGRDPSVADFARVEYLPLDLTVSLPALPRGIDTVLHMAGEKRDEFRMQSVNHAGTRKLAEAAASAGVRRFVYVSSVGVYGAKPNSGIITESYPHKPKNPYELSKDQGEQCVREICARSNMEYVILQPSNVIGIMNDQPYPLLGLMKSVYRGRFLWFGMAEPWTNYVMVEDLAAVICLAIEEHALGGQTYIINTPARLVNIVAWIAEELDVPMPHRRLPMWVGYAAGELGSGLAHMLGHVLPIDRDRFIALTNSTKYDPSSFVKMMKFEYPCGIEAGIRGLVKAYRRGGFL